MVNYYINGNKVAEVYARHRFATYQRRMRGASEGAISVIWDACHTDVETRIRELPDNLEMVVE